METNRIELVLCVSFSMGGLTLVTSAKAILGFIRFVRCYYLVVVTETKPEGIIMGHVIYSITVRNTIEFQIELRSNSAQNRALLQKQAQIPPLSQERGRRFQFPRGFHAPFRGGFPRGHRLRSEFLAFPRGTARRFRLREGEPRDIRGTAGRFRRFIRGFGL